MRIRVPRERFSQSTSEEFSRVVLQLPSLTVGHYMLFTDIATMVVQPFSYSLGRRTRQRTRAPGEGQGTPRLTPSKRPEPQLKVYGYFIHEGDLPIRKGNVTKADAKGLHPIRQPVGATRTGPGNPGPEDPTTIGLRNSTGNETCPHRLPDSSVGVDNTPMGLATTTTYVGVAARTYYTAKKK